MRAKLGSIEITMITDMTPVNIVTLELNSRICHFAEWKMLLFIINVTMYLDRSPELEKLITHDSS